MLRERGWLLDGGGFSSRAPLKHGCRFVPVLYRYTREVGDESRGRGEGTERNRERDRVWLIASE